MSESVGTMKNCSRCDRSIELCACCDELDCGAPICHACLNVALGQAKPQPHVHGG